MQDIPDGLQLTPYDPIFFADPYAVYRQLRETDPVHQDRVSMFGTSWTLTRYADIHALLRDPRLSVDPRKVGQHRDPRARNPVTDRAPNMMNLDDPEHRRLRGLVEKAFNNKRVQAFKQTLEQITQECLEAYRGKRFDLIEVLANPLPSRAIAHFLGFDPAQHADFKRWTTTLLLQGYPMPTDAQWQAVIAADTEQRAYIREVISARKQRPRDDLISVLTQISLDEGDDGADSLSDSELEDMCELLIGAGNFTTSDLIGNAVLALLQHPEEFAKLRSDPTTYLPRAVQEAMRFDGPSLVARRYALEDIEWEGQHIQRGSTLNLMIAAGNHDPDYFETPDQFLLDRDPKPHLGFGVGAHHCVGFLLARVQLEVALAGLIALGPQLNLESHTRGKNMLFRNCKTLVVESG